MAGLFMKLSLEGKSPKFEMSSNCPIELNFLVPFLQRANEMAEAQPVLSYYCKYYAVSLALKGGPTRFKRTPQTDTFLAKLFDDLEEEKAKLSSHSTIQELSQGAILVRELAYRIFISAEKQESSPETLKKALQSYLAAINFLQVYRGIFLEDPTALELDEEERLDELVQVDEKSKYAKWRVVEIKKQLLMSNLDMKTSINDPLQSIKPTSPQIVHQPAFTSELKELSPSTAAPHNSSSSSPTLLYDPKVLSDCEKHARHAISALNFDDIETAAENLRTALNILQPLLNNKQQQ